MTVEAVAVGNLGTPASLGEVARGEGAFMYIKGRRETSRRVKKTSIKLKTIVTKQKS